MVIYFVWQIVRLGDIAGVVVCIAVRHNFRHKVALFFNFLQSAVYKIRLNLPLGPLCVLAFKKKAFISRSFIFLTIAFALVKASFLVVLESDDFDIKLFYRVKLLLRRKQYPNMALKHFPSRVSPGYGHIPMASASVTFFQHGAKAPPETLWTQKISCETGGILVFIIPIDRICFR